MGKIYKLSLNEIAKIAAGEVVERPAHILKELIENSLDAGSSAIDVHIHQGGQAGIRVVDDGCGMDADDANTCFEQHATSKITGVDDLENISTFGFRGEGLASISAVSKVTLKTKQSIAQTGTQVVVEGAVIQQSESTACPDGTDISVADIFFNVPARKKFLKAADTEWRHINLLFQAYALCKHGIHWRLFHNDTLVHNCPPVEGTIKRVMQLWDIHTANHMLAITGTHEGTKTSINGVASNHLLSRYNTSQILFFVNNRWIKNSTLLKAFMRAYAGVHQPGKYPVGCLFITTNQNSLDVNIHPRKEEVRFLHEHTVEQLVQSAVHSALEKDVSTKLGASTQQPTTFIPAWSMRASKEQAITSPWRSNNQTASEQIYTGASHKQLQAQVPEISEVQATLVQPGYHLLGQLHKTYILIERDEQLVIIDQHAAHERILYELFASRTQRLISVALTNPVRVALPAEQIKNILAATLLLEQYGMMVDQIAQDQLMVRQVSTHLKNSDISELIQSLAQDLMQENITAHEHAQQKLEHSLRARMACTAAVKAGDQLNPEHMHTLISDLASTPNNLTCPHGRPTLWQIDAHELAKRFKRII